MRNKAPKCRFTCGVIALVLVCCAVLFPMPSFAEDITVRVGYYENELFQEGAQPGSVKTGYAYEYYQKLSEYTGWKYEYVYGGFNELYQMLLSGDIDLLAGLAWRAERDGPILYPSSPMGHENYYLIKHDTDEDIVSDPASFSGKKIGVLDSAMVSVLNDYLAGSGAECEVVIYPDHPELFNAFDSHQVDILAAESDGVNSRDHAEVLLVFGASDYYLCVSTARPDLVKSLNEAQELLEVEEPNYLNSLCAKYYSASITARAFSASERKWLSDHDSLRIGYLDNYLPYSGTDDEGLATGIIRDIVPAMLTSLNITDIPVLYTGYKNYDEMIAAMNAGTIDAAFPVGGGLYYSEENGIYQSSAVVSAPTELVYKGEFGDSTLERFAVNENNRMQYYYVRTNFPDAAIVQYSSIDACLMAVLSGEVSCTTLNGLRANDILKNSKYKGLSLRQSTRNDDRCFGVKIGNEGLLKLINRGISVLGSDYAQNLSYRYTSGLYSYDFWDMLREHMALVGAIILVIAALIIFLLVRDGRRSRKVIREKEAARRTLEDKNRELKESQEALSDALNAAENASRAKTAFLNNMSHDIRTPMNAIMGFTALAQSHIDDKDQVQDYLGKISVSSQHLLSLINDVLDMSRIESGNVSIDYSPVHLPDIIHDLKIIIRPNVEGKKQEMTCDTQNIRHEDIISDKLRLTQILLNILSNAVKFTPEGGAIHFSAEEKPTDNPDEALYEFRIRDNGIGMSPQFREMIFEAFTRERTSTVSGIQGTGLGMAITKNIVDMMGGTITVTSEEGKGSEFVVLIPCRIAASPLPAGPAPEGEENDAEKRKPNGKRILLAEDNEMNQMIARSILTDAGYQVDIAADGTEAVKKITQSPGGTYDVILMDIQMPRMDGYTAAKQIRALPDRDKSGIPIIAVTANAFEEDRKVALEAGMNGHLAKPYDIPVILSTLEEMLK